jgi:hypothetical protein
MYIPWAYIYTPYITNEPQEKAFLVSGTNRSLLPYARSLLPCTRSPFAPTDTPVMVGLFCF